jgi:hypothetical protein
VQQRRRLRCDVFIDEETGVVTIECPGRPPQEFGDLSHGRPPVIDQPDLAGAGQGESDGDSVERRLEDWASAVAAGKECFEWGAVGAVVSTTLTGPVGVAAAVGVSFVIVITCADAGRRFASVLHGEPHIVTLDGHNYHLQAIGEFVHLRSGGFEVQSRFEGTKGSATSTQATAVRAGDHVIESYYDDSTPTTGGLPVVLDGEEVEIGYAGRSLPDGTFVARGSGGDNGRTVLVVDPEGNHVLVENLSRSQNVVVGLSPTGVQRAEGGLAGTPDGDRANDFTLPDGTVLGWADARTVHGLYGRFAGGWRVRPAQRLFTRGRAEAFLTPHFTRLPSDVSRLLDFDAAAVEAARETCRSSGVASGSATEDCAYDLLVTRDQRWAGQAGRSEITEERRRDGDSEREHGDHPLLVAADDCDVPVIARELARGADPNLQRADDGWTPLMFAAQASCPSAVRSLLDAGAEPDLGSDEEHVTALYLASQNGLPEIVDILLRAGPIHGWRGTTATRRSWSPPTTGTRTSCAGCSPPGPSWTSPVGTMPSRRFSPPRRRGTRTRRSPRSCWPTAPTPTGSTATSARRSSRRRSAVMPTSSSASWTLGRTPT